MLYFDFKRVLRPARLADVESAVDIYCQHMGVLRDAELDLSTDELREWSNAIRIAGETVKAADRAISAIEGHVIRFNGMLNVEQDDGASSAIESIESRLSPCTPATSASDIAEMPQQPDNHCMRGCVVDASHTLPMHMTEHTTSDELDWGVFLRSPSCKTVGMYSMCPISATKTIE